jgi:imidazolonepropionase-like amidohydrolase
VTVVDVERAALLPDRTVLLDGGVIRRIGPALEVQVPEGARIVEGRGLYLAPGLIDAHVHYIDPGTFGPLMIAHGVTLVRDMGGPNGVVLGLRRQLNEGELLGPEMVGTGEILDGEPPFWPFSIVCRTAEEGRAAVRGQIAAGADQIKVYSRLGREVYLAIVDEAHKRGVKAVGHVPMGVSMEEAIEAGQDSAEHLLGFGPVIARLAGESAGPPSEGPELAKSGWDCYAEVDKAKLREFLGRARESGMAQCPTLVVIQGISRLRDPKAREDPALDYVPSALMGFWESETYEFASEGAGRALPAMQAMVAEMHRAGVTLMCGTDLANPHVVAGHSLHEEMALWQEAGVPAADVLRSATIVPARFCGVGDRLGTVAEGRAASLVLLRGNPLEDVRNARQIEGVFLRGRYFNRAALDALLADVKAVAAASRPTEEEVELSLPGTVVRRGRYVATFEQWPAGWEEFLITRDEQGYHVMAHQRPQGGPMGPFVLEMHVGPDFRLRSAEWRPLSQAGIEAIYSREDSMFEARAQQAGRQLPPQTLTAPASSLFSAPAYASEMFTIGAAGIKVGQSRTFQMVSFGFPSWQMTVSQYTLSRGEDISLALPSGKELRARHYTSTRQTPMGPLGGETWTDAEGVVLKTRLKMPFGTVEARLEQGRTPEDSLLDRPGAPI